MNGSPAPTSPPSPQKLLRLYRNFKSQEYPDLARKLFEIGLETIPHRSRTDPSPEIAWIRSLLPDEVLSLSAAEERELDLAGWQDLFRAHVQATLVHSILEDGCRQRQTQGKVLKQELLRSARAAVQHALQLDRRSRARAAMLERGFAQRRDGAPRVVEEVAERCVQLLEDMDRVSPAPRLVFAHPGDRFSPREHAPEPGCPDRGRVVLALFPGYAIRRPGRPEDVVEKASVITGEGELSSAPRTGRAQGQSAHGTPEQTGLWRRLGRMLLFWK